MILDSERHKNKIWKKNSWKNLYINLLLNSNKKKRKKPKKTKIPK